MRPKYYANQILRGKTPLSLEDQREDFKLYVSMQREPMKFVKHKGRDVRVPKKAGFQSSSCVQDRLKRRETNLRKTNKKGIAVINLIIQLIIYASTDPYI